MGNALKIGFIILLLAGCQKNDYLIPEDQLVDLIVDIHIVEGIMQTDYGLFVSAVDRSATLELVFENHGIERERFDSTMHYYALNPVEYDGIYQKVLNKLILIESNVKSGHFDKSSLLMTQQLIQTLYPQDSVLLDSAYREFWWKNRSFLLPGDVKTSKGDFELNVGDTVVGKAYLLRADILLYPDDCSIEPKITLMAEYFNGLVDSVAVDILKDSLLRSYEIYLPLTDSVALGSLYGAFVNDEGCFGQKHAEVKNIRIYEIVDSGHPKLAKPGKLLLKQ